MISWIWSIYHVFSPWTVFFFFLSKFCRPRLYFPFLYSTTKKVAGYYTSPQKSGGVLCYTLWTVWVSGRYRTLTWVVLHGHWYQVEWFGIANGLNSLLNSFINNRGMALDWCKDVFFFNIFRINRWILIKFCICIDMYKIHIVSNVHYFRLIFNIVMALDLCKKCVFPQYLQNKWMTFDKIVYMHWYIQDPCCF